MADHFNASTEAFRDWLPYSGRFKSPGTVDQYVTAAQRTTAVAVRHDRPLRD